MSILKLDRITVQEDLAADRLDFVGQNSGVAHLSVSDGGPVAVGGGNLGLDTGQSIEDGSGAERFSMGSTFTRIFAANGNVAFNADNSTTQIQADSTTPIRFYDREGGFDAVQYDTDTSSGILSAPNAGLFVQGAGKPTSGEGISIRQTPGDPTIESENYGTTTYVGLTIRSQGLNLDARGGLVDLSNGGGSDLRLDTGQAIEDGSGRQRVELGSGFTRLYDGSSRKFLTSNNGVSTTLFAYSNQKVKIGDENGGFNALEYQDSSAAPGTLELTNAGLTGAQGAFGTVAGPQPATIEIGGESSSFSYSLKFENTDGQMSALQTDDGELQAYDDAGNSTILT